MISKTITSLAILKVNWDKNHKDYIENFVPFMTHLIKVIGYSKIDVNKLRQDFMTEYGINLPYHPAITILNRLKQHGYIVNENNKFIPLEEKIIEDDFAEVSNSQSRKIKQILNEFIAFYDEVNDANITMNVAEEIFISFLKDHDLNILFASHENGLLPDVEISKLDSYTMVQFIKKISETNDDLFKKLVDISVGHILANTILFNEFNSYLGEFKNNNYYLDVPIILELIGASGTERQAVYDEFIKNLLNVGIKLYIFNHTYDELLHNLESCLRWIDSPGYDPYKASRTLNYFIVNGFTSSKIESFIAKVPVILKKYNIEIVDEPSYFDLKDYLIDEEELKKKIIDLYKTRDPHFNEIEKDYMIQNDVDSISAIYRLRAGKIPRTLEDAGHIFITKNSTLAYASSIFERENIKGFTINTCVTDTFIGTLIWLRTPALMYQINMKKLIADVYAALQPDSKLIRSYLNEIIKLHKEGNISDEEYYLLRSHRVAINMLEEKTLGDPDRFTDKTPEEILADIKKKYEIEGNKKYLKEKTAHNRTSEKLNTVKSDLKKINTKHNKIAEQIAKYSSWLVFNIMLIGLFLILYFNFFITFYPENKIIIPAIILLIISLINFAFGINLIGIKEMTYSFIKDKILSILSP